MNFEEMSHEQRLYIFVLGLLMDLKDKGYVDGGDSLQLTPKAFEWYEQLKDNGFRPTQEDLAKVMRYVQSMDHALLIRDILGSDLLTPPQEII
jgi:hypothetical protein